jgi:hypothetical protein
MKSGIYYKRLEEIMKKIPLFLVLASVLLVSTCGPDWPRAHISNESGYPVTFKFAHYNQEYTLPAGKSISLDGGEWSRTLDSYDPEKRVLFSSTSNHDGLRGTFKKRQSWKLEVKNMGSRQGTLTADGWMDPESIDITQLPVNGVIFTDEPSFTVTTTDSFPADVKYEIIDDTMYVTIK